MRIRTARADELFYKRCGYSDRSAEQQLCPDYSELYHDRRNIAMLLILNFQLSLIVIFFSR